MTDDKDRGLYRKYVVHRTDGSSGPGGKHENCEYFVLDLAHDPHAIDALAAYANACERSHPRLYDDLTDKLARLMPNYRRCVPLRKSGEPERTCAAPAVIPLGNGCWFCVEHAVDFHVRGHELSRSALAALARRGVEVPEGRQL